MKTYDYAATNQTLHALTRTSTPELLTNWRGRETELADLIHAGLIRSANDTGSIRIGWSRDELDKVPPQSSAMDQLTDRLRENLPGFGEALDRLSIKYL